MQLNKYKPVNCSRKLHIFPLEYFLKVEHVSILFFFFFFAKFLLVFILLTPYIMFWF